MALTNRRPRTRRDKQEGNNPVEWGGADLDAANRDYLDKMKLPGTSLDFVYSPNEAVSPTDCERWPGSPFCGGLPELELIGAEVGISKGECEALIEVDMTIGFWKAPPFHAGVRWCAPPPPALPPGAPNAVQIPLEGARDWCMYRVWTRQTGTSFTEGIHGGLRPLINERDDYVWGPVYGVSMTSRNVTSWTGLPLKENRIWIHCHGWARGPDNPNFSGRGPAGSFLAQDEVATTQGIPSVSAWLSKVGFCLDINPVPNIPFVPSSNAPMCNCKQIEADLRAIKKYLGVEKAGWSVPDSLRGTTTNHQEISNFTDFAAWFATQFIETIGDTKIKITVKDADPIADGDQEKTLIFDNLAQAVTELLGLALSGAANQSLIYKTATNALLQAGEATIAASKAALNIDEIIDFLAYGVREETEDLNLFFTPGKDDPDEFLDPSEQKVEFRQMVDKQTMQSFMQKLLTMAAIYTSLNSINPDSEDFPKMIEGIRQLSKGTDLNSFINEVESGFQGAAGNPEITRPYGGPYSQRPRIKKWEGDGSDDGGTT